MVPSLASEKIPSDTTEDRSRDLPTSSAVPPIKAVILFYMNTEVSVYNIYNDTDASYVKILQ
jgi:hypothetical protein